MAERDRFELDLAAALRAYAEDAPTQMRPTELARHFATAYPHGRTSIAGWRFAAVPRLAWVLLLGAALLAALVGGVLLIGSQERRLPAVVPPVGQVYECPPGSTPDEPGPVDQARPSVRAWPHAPAAVAFDRRAGRLVVVANAGDGVETWTFDVCTNTWAKMDPDREPPRPPDDEAAWRRLVYDVDSDVTIWVSSGKVWAYDLQTNTWTQKGGAPPGARLGAYDPISGLVVARVAPLALARVAEVWNYDVETDTWTPIHTAIEPRPASNGVFAYDASVGRMVAYVEGYEVTATSWTTIGRVMEAWLFDIRTGTWSRTGAVAPQFDALGSGQVPAIAYDEAAERTVMMGADRAAWPTGIIGGGRAAAYDATADRWESLWAKPFGDEEGSCGTRPECRGAPGMVYDPVNERLVVYGGGSWTGKSPASAWVSPDDVLAFDTRTREWTVLLEASGQ